MLIKNPNILSKWEKVQSYFLTQQKPVWTSSSTLIITLIYLLLFQQGRMIILFLIRTVPGCDAFLYPAITSHCEGEFSVTLACTALCWSGSCQSLDDVTRNHCFTLKIKDPEKCTVSTPCLRGARDGTAKQTNPQLSLLSCETARLMFHWPSTDLVDTHTLTHSPLGLKKVSTTF